jgi:hypothetical protein
VVLEQRKPKSRTHGSCADMEESGGTKGREEKINEEKKYM